MIYGKDKNGVALLKDVFAEQFAEPDEIQYNYMVELYGEIVDEDQNPKDLSKRLEKIAERLFQIARFLKRIKA